MARWPVGMTLVLVLEGIGGLGCFVDSSKQRVVETTPEFYARNVKGYAETAAGQPPEEVYAWNLTVAGDVAKWRECKALDECSNVERTRPAREVLGVLRVGETSVDGKRVDVVKLALEPRRGYIVPATKP